MKVVYVTGCLGFIGSYITRTCLEKGWYVRGIDKMTYASNPNLLNEFNKYDNFIFENKDINDIEFLYECDYIVNTAAETHVGNSIVKSEDFLHSNVNGVHNLLELIRNYRAETDKLPILLHFSTDEVYGDITKGEHIETDILNPSNPYSATKAAADKLIPKSIKYLGLDKPIPLHNDGTPIRNWLHAQDTADAVITIIERPYHVRDEIYNICGGFEQSNLTTVKKIIELYHQEDEDLADKFPHYPQRRVFEYIDFDYSRQGQDIRYALNDDKLRKLGWKPKKIFDDELPAIVEYYQNNFIW